MLSKNTFLQFLVFVIFFLPLISSGQAVITEIMYDLEGSDSGREWIEVYNSLGSAIDLSTWKFFENGTNHNLVLYQGDGNVSAGGVAIISDNPVKFLADYPSFNGTIFDSSFSLSNTGETIIIRNDLLEDVDSVSYVSDWGGGGDGNSLNLTSSGWGPSAPTPGSYQGTSQAVTETEQSNNTTSSGGGGGPSVNFPVGNIEAKIIGENVLLSGADAFFEGKSWGVEGEPLLSARYLWNFGDGSLKDGENVLHNYIYPGEYILFLDVSSENFTASDKLYITVIPSSILISSGQKEIIKIKNSSSKELNISRWIIQANDKYFNLPKNTYIGANKEIILAREVTFLNGEDRPLRLLYPNGRTAYEYITPQVQIVSENNNVSNRVSAQQQTENILNTELYKTENEEVKDPEIVPPQESVDNVALTSLAKTEEGASSIWIVLLVSLILLSIYGVYWLVDSDNKVEGFTIIE